MLRWKIFLFRMLAVAWLIFMCVLFFLPGSALPPENRWMELVHFDKWVHIGLFAVLIFLWRSSFNLDLKQYELILLCAALLYGFAVELIQLYWVSNRSFDLYDVLADMFGAAVGLLVWCRVYKK